MLRRTRVRTPVRPAPSTDGEARDPRSRARTPSAPRRPVRHSRGTLRALLAYRDAFAVDRRAWPVLRLRPRYPATRVDGQSRRNLASDASKVARDGPRPLRDFELFQNFHDLSRTFITLRTDFGEFAIKFMIIIMKFMEFHRISSYSYK